MQVEKELLNLHTGWSLTESTIPDAESTIPDAESTIPDAVVLIQFDLPMMSTVLLETCRGL